MSITNISQVASVSVLGDYISRRLAIRPVGSKASQATTLHMVSRKIILLVAYSNCYFLTRKMYCIVLYCIWKKLSRTVNIMYKTYWYMKISVRSAILTSFIFLRLIPFSTDSIHILVNIQVYMQ